MEANKGSIYFMTFDKLRNFLYRLEDIRKKARALHTLYEFDCNFGLNEKQAKRQQKLEGQIKDFAFDFGLGIHFQRDPRGCPVYLIDKIEMEYTNGIPIC